MKSSLLALALLTAAVARAPAQETTQGQMCANIAVMPPPAGKAQNRLLSDDAEVTGRVGVSKESIKPGQALSAQVVLSAGLLHHAAVEYRRSSTPPMVHTRMAEFFYVLDGEADLILGGTLTNPVCRNSSNLVGDGVEGGVTHHVKKGTYILVPENTAHYFTNIDKKQGMTVLDLHVPTPAADQF
ncbi:MAG TPA: cupin domain-containing protein [Terriglobia bacterium]|nr:cupin domain-containing protein [Terriglobia bacterium]